MSKRILILTVPDDAHALGVAEALRHKGGEVTLWQTSDFPSRARQSLWLESDGVHFAAMGPELELDHPHPDVVWLRRPTFVLDEQVVHPADRQFARSQCSEFLRSSLMLLAPSAFWVNPPAALGPAGFKMLQHHAALASGLEAPPTLYSNDPDRIRQFIRAHGGEVVYKSLGATADWHDGPTRFLTYTAALTEEQLVGDALLMAAPGIYQARIDKAYELRVTFMGRRAFAAKLHSQETRGGKLDWRQSYEDLRMEPIEIPAALERACHGVMDQLGTVFGCFDFIVTPDGRYVFLEVNDMGQWLFVEDMADMPLLDPFCEFLLQGRVDFEWRPSPAAIRYRDIEPRVAELIASAQRVHTSPPFPSADESEAA